MHFNPFHFSLYYFPINYFFFKWTPPFLQCPTFFNISTAIVFFCFQLNTTFFWRNFANDPIRTRYPFRITFRCQKKGFQFLFVSWRWYFCFFFSRVFYYQLIFKWTLPHIYRPDIIWYFLSLVEATTSRYNMTFLIFDDVFICFSEKCGLKSLFQTVDEST